VAYVETHGTGTALGDPMEVHALAGVFGQADAADSGAGSGGSALCLGAAKSVLGHAEGAAGLVGVLKALLCLAHGQVPRNLHCAPGRVNPKVAEAMLARMVLPLDRPFALPAGRAAGVSSFGFGGTNAHAVLCGVEGLDGVAGAEGATVPRSKVLLRAAAATAAVAPQQRALGPRLDWAAPSPLTFSVEWQQWPGPFEAPPRQVIAVADVAGAAAPGRSSAAGHARILARPRGRGRLGLRALGPPREPWRRRAASAAAPARARRGHPARLGRAPPRGRAAGAGAGLAHGPALCAAAHAARAARSAIRAAVAALAPQ
jgi:acyl transferase domain-containing protein